MPPLILARADQHAANKRRIAWRLFRMMDGLGISVCDLACLVVFLPNAYSEERESELLSLCEKTVVNLNIAVFSPLRRQKALEDFFKTLRDDVTSCDDTDQRSRFELANSFDALRIMRDRIDGVEFSYHEYQFAVRCFGLPLGADVINMMAKDPRVSALGCLERIRCSGEYNLLHLYKFQSALHWQYSAYLSKVVSCVHRKPLTCMVFDRTSSLYHALQQKLGLIGGSLEDVHTLCGDLECDNECMEAAHDLRYMHAVILCTNSPFKCLETSAVREFLRERQCELMLVLAEFALTYTLASLSSRDCQALEALVHAILRLYHIDVNLADFEHVMSLDAIRLESETI
eukprot:3931695-Rhodomonas_salina.1